VVKQRQLHQRAPGPFFIDLKWKITQQGKASAQSSQQAEPTNCRCSEVSLDK